MTGAAETDQLCCADAKSMRIPKIYHFGSLSSVQEGGANCVPVCLLEFTVLDSSQERHDKAQPTVLTHEAHLHSLMSTS